MVLILLGGRPFGNIVRNILSTGRFSWSRPFQRGIEAQISLPKYLRPLGELPESILGGQWGGGSSPIVSAEKWRTRELSTESSLLIASYLGVEAR